MKSYPSIPGSTGQDFQEFDAYVFDKYDGSNLRAEYAKKRGFYKFGTRNCLFDKTDPILVQQSICLKNYGRISSGGWPRGNDGIASLFSANFGVQIHLLDLTT